MPVDNNFQKKSRVPASRRAAAGGGGRVSPRVRVRVRPRGHERGLQHGHHRHGGLGLPVRHGLCQVGSSRRLTQGGLVGVLHQQPPLC